MPLTRSELNSHAAIDHAPIKGRPRVDGPSSIDRLVSAQDRIPSGLKHAGQVLTVDEESQRSDAPFGQHANNDVRLPDIAIWVGFESLATGVVHLYAEPAVFIFDHADKAETMTRRLRDVITNPIDRFARLHIGVARGDGKRCPAERPEEFHPDIRGRFQEVAERVR